MDKIKHQLTVDEMKEIELSILKDVADFCEKNNLRYYLCGGTLIGAVRHKGFIPWDDDIDIIMPRPDYMKFVMLYNNKGKKRYTVRSIFNDSTFWRAFAQVFDNKTIMKEENLNPKYATHPIAIDVFPMDGVPENQIVRNIIFLLQKLLHVIYYAAITAYKPSHHYENRAGNFVKWKGKIRTAMKYLGITLFGSIPAPSVIKMINNIAMKWSFTESTYVAAYIELNYPPEKEMNKRWDFESGVYKNFECEKFLVPVGYDHYLKNLYGDYMKLPPVEKRVSVHTFNAYWKDEVEQ